MLVNLDQFKKANDNYGHVNRRKALTYIDLFNIKQASGTDPYGVPGTGATNAYGSYIESKVKALNKLILLRYFPQHFQT
jgi:hypothetical protein